MSKIYKSEEREISEFSALEPDATYSYADYLRWTFDERVELIKGKIFKMSPAPGRKHQEISFQLTRLLSNFLNGHPCQGYTAPFDVRLPDHDKSTNKTVYTVVQPDLCIICDPEKLDDKGCTGAPDLIIEILSPSTSSKDLRDKYILYEEHGVKEYWLVYPGESIVEIFELGQEQKYLTGVKYVGKDEISSRVMPGLVINTTDIFSD